MTVQTPRGIRNNNPCNIIRTSDKWHGMTKPQTDRRFCTFTAPEMGLRAAIICVRRILQNTDGRLDTLIEKWAPSTENDTLAYIKSVSISTGLKADSVVPFARVENVCNLMRAIVVHENGACPYSDTVFEKAFALS